MVIEDLGDLTFLYKMVSNGILLYVHCVYIVFHGRRVSKCRLQTCRLADRNVFVKSVGIQI